MTGRGRPRKAKSPDTKCVKIPTRAEETNPGKAITEEKQNGTAKEKKPQKRQQKKPNHNEENPSVQSTSSEKTTKHFTEEIGKLQKTPTDKTKAPVQGTKAKNCAGRDKPPKQFEEEQTEKPKDTTKDSVQVRKGKTCAGRTKSPKQFEEEPTEKPKDTKAKTSVRKAKSPEQFTEETIKTQPEILKDTTKPSLITKKAKTCNGKAKLQEQTVEEIKTSQPDTPKDTRKDSVQVRKAKTCAGRTKSPKQFEEEMTQMQPKPPKDMTEDLVEIRTNSPENSKEETMKKQQKTVKTTTKACEPQGKCKDEAGVDSILRTTLEKLKIRKDDRSEAAKVINNIVRHIREHLKNDSQCFREVQEPLHTGSYYENLKISHPDEFDVMLPIPVERVDIKPFGEDGAFYSVALKRGKSPLEKFQKETSILSASEMLKEFRDEVIKCVKTFKEWEVTKKKKGCPAVTLTTEVKSVTISLDIVLCLVVKSSWPAFTKDGFKIEGWLGTKVKQQYKRMPYYLVPKYEGRGTMENDGVCAKDVWRVSFSHVEKAILKNHGSEKTCCEEAGVRCCRKDCLKLLKHLLSLLKERDSFDKFCSYHAKTTFLHACCSRTKDTDWKTSNLSHCFQMLLKDFEDHLEKGVLHNFFIPTQNLLSSPTQNKRRSLAKCVRNELENGFPIFK